MLRSRARVLVLAAVTTSSVACQLLLDLGGERVDDGASDGGAGRGDGSADGSVDGGACGAAPEAVIQVAAGGSSACALTQSGHVYCWGEGTSGELAVDPDALASCAGGHRCSPRPAAIPSLDGARSVAVGAGVACAIAKDGAVWCWGTDDEKQLGQTDASDTTCLDGRACRFAPKQLAAAIDDAGDASSLSVSGRTACARIAPGQAVSCWGSNAWNLLGPDGPRFDPSDPTPHFVGWRYGADGSFPTDSVSLSLCSKVDGRPCHGCILDTAGDIACWGANPTGETGHDPKTDPDASCPGACNATPAIVTDATDSYSVASGDGATCMVRYDDGHVLCWGNAINGQLGVDAGVRFTWSPQDLGAFIASTIDGRGRTFCAVTPSGDVYCWGRTTDGEVGVLDASTCEAGRCEGAPKLVALPAKVRQISVGDSFAVALGTNGVVYTWGANADGRLGHAPGSAGDVTCGTHACNPVPTPVCW